MVSGMGFLATKHCGNQAKKWLDNITEEYSSKDY